jgi:sodium transport system permease protein
LNLRKILVVYSKELTDLLRDRRTMMSMVVIPVVMFPLLTVGMGYFASMMMGKAKEETPCVMILGGEDSPQFLAQIHEIKKVEFVPGAPDYAAQISDKRIQAAIMVPPDFDRSLGSGVPSQVRIYFYEGEIKSSFASEYLQKFLNNLRNAMIRQRLASHHLPALVLEPFSVAEQNVAPPEKVAGAALGGLVPYFVIILCFTWAMYPAMDLTAGEKERGTMETILCSPVSRTDLVLGRFLMVVTASLTTAILVIYSMGLSILYGQRFLSSGGDSLHFSIGLKGIAAVFLMVLPLSVIFSAALLAVSVFAKSYREAQSYVSPLTFVIILPAIVAILPGSELTASTALIPILNTSLVSKEIVSGIYQWATSRLSSAAPASTPPSPSPPCFFSIAKRFSSGSDPGASLVRACKAQLCVARAMPLENMPIAVPLTARTRARRTNLSQSPAAA